MTITTLGSDEPDDYDRRRDNGFSVVNEPHTPRTRHAQVAARRRRTVADAQRPDPCPPPEAA
jgi:hypothetical protein